MIEVQGVLRDLVLEKVASLLDPKEMCALEQICRQLRHDSKQITEEVCLRLCRTRGYEGTAGQHSWKFVSWSCAAHWAVDPLILEFCLGAQGLLVDVRTHHSQSAAQNYLPLEAFDVMRIRGGKSAYKVAAVPAG